MIVDVSTFVGPYPFRELPDTSAEGLVREMDRVAIDRACVGYLPSFLLRDPTPGNARLCAALHGHEDRLLPVFTVHPDLPAWQRDVERCRDAGGVAIRLFPMHQSVDPAGSAMRDVVVAAGALKLPTILTVRFEDVRQRHPFDVARDFPPSAVRSLARVDPDVRLIVTHASREFVEEVFFGLTKEEAARVLFDVTWLWGPPSNDLRILVSTVGAERFVFGSAMPLRIPEATPAKLDLAQLDQQARAKIHAENLRAWIPRLRT
jgi:predicted TIM-barrel fold metal-dependent hydrolase